MSLKMKYFLYKKISIHDLFLYIEFKGFKLHIKFKVLSCM